MLSIENQKEFAKIFLLKFTEQLILNSTRIEIIAPEIKEPKLEKEDIKKLVKESIKQESKVEKEPLSISSLKKGLEISRPVRRPMMRPRMHSQRRKPIRAKLGARVLRIPEPRLPPTMQYLKPTPKPGKEIDLQKLNPVIQDPAVREIQCDGYDKNVIVRGVMGSKKTDIILSKEEIKQILEKFSKEAKIPLQEGVFKVVFGNLILSAIVSEIISSKFVIRKMITHPGFVQQQQRQQQQPQQTRQQIHKAPPVR